MIIFVIAGICFSSSSLYAQGDNGIYTLKMTETKFVIVDTNSKKMLVYIIGSKGLLLKEVRSFENALNSDNFTSSKGLTFKDEKAHFKD
jgi:hypothetical protein